MSGFWFGSSWLPLVSLSEEGASGFFFSRSVGSEGGGGGSRCIVEDRLRDCCVQGGEGEGGGGKKEMVLRRGVARAREMLGQVERDVARRGSGETEKSDSCSVQQRQVLNSNWRVWSSARCAGGSLHISGGGSHTSTSPTPTSGSGPVYTELDDSQCLYVKGGLPTRDAGMTTEEEEEEAVAPVRSVRDGTTQLSPIWDEVQCYTSPRPDPGFSGRGETDSLFGGWKIARHSGIHCINVTFPTDLVRQSPDAPLHAPPLPGTAGLSGRRPEVRVMTGLPCN